MSEGDGRTHGCTPYATISCDYALPLSTNKTDDNDLSPQPPPYSCATSNHAVIVLADNLATRSRHLEKLRRKCERTLKRPLLSARLPALGSSPRSEPVGRAFSLTLKRQQKTLQAWRALRRTQLTHKERWTPLPPPAPPILALVPTVTLINLLKKTVTQVFTAFDSTQVLFKYHLMCLTWHL